MHLPTRGYVQNLNLNSFLVALLDADGIGELSAVRADDSLRISESCFPRAHCDLDGKRLIAFLGVQYSNDPTPIDGVYARAVRAECQIRHAVRCWLLSRQKHLPGCRVPDSQDVAVLVGEALGVGAEATAWRVRPQRGGQNP